jgi:phosphonate transport system substrate-binding protein
MAPNADRFYARLASWLTGATEHAVAVEDRVAWQQRAHMLARGEVHIGFVCGLTYVRDRQADRPLLELLAAPVMRADRYAGRAVYFSDVVVRRDSPCHAFGDLRGAAWSYNEPGSHSGYNLPRAHLARMGARADFFSRVVESGAHQESLRMIVAGTVDAAAIDSIVLEAELGARPELRDRIRVIETLGPSPAPPAVVHASTPRPIQRKIRTALLAMHRDPRGAKLLQSARITRFAPVADPDYDPIREADRTAGEIQWTQWRGHDSGRSGNHE